jgi:hypothetical protein
VPAGYSPFNAQVVGNSLYVAYALVDPVTHRDQAGLGHGIVDQFDLAGNFVRRVATGGMLNSPWGVEIAPSSFGKFAGALLVGNFGDGHVLAYDATSGAFLGTLADPGGNPLALGDLWAISHGTGIAGGDGGALYFATGLDNEAHGLLGKLVASTTVQAASSSPGSAIAGTAADDQLVGSGGNDTFTALAGSDTIAGNGGHDVLVLSGHRSAWTLSLHDTRGHEAGTLTGPGGTKLIDSIEEIRFDDGRMVFDDAALSANAPVAYRLYLAALGRLPDQGGLEVQAHALDAGLTPLQLASNFYHSAEFQTRFGNQSDAQFVTLLYQNVLGRTPDPGGFAVQVNALAQGLSREQLLLNFSESPENVAHTHANTDLGYLLLV